MWRQGLDVAAMDLLDEISMDASNSRSLRTMIGHSWVFALFQSWHHPHLNLSTRENSPVIFHWTKNTTHLDGASKGELQQQDGKGLNPKWVQAQCGQLGAQIIGMYVIDRQKSKASTHV
jgi:hypothetical protein